MTTLESEFARLLKLEPEERALKVSKLKAENKDAFLRIYQFGVQQQNNPYLKYLDDPIGFIEKGLKEDLWSKQREILESIRDNKRTAVPACHAPGKSHLAARVVAWWGSVHPPSETRIVTTATNYRQVRGVLWPQIRRVINSHNLRGHCFTTEWQIDGELIADGFSAYNHDETAVQGVHAPHLLVVVDEAGGITPTLGRALESLMTGGHTRLLVLGNPPVDNESSWFENVCNSDLYNVIPIAAKDTPNFTGEKVGDWGKNLVDQTWVDDVVRQFGADSPFVEARVHARFPRVTANRVIPYDWLERAVETEVPIDGEVIKLGVDVAADGGDEFAIAVADGFKVSMRHHTSGNANASAVDVAGVVLQHIQEAEQKHRERQIQEPVRVKIDSIGVGWGVTSILQKWRDEQRHSAVVVGVNVAERSRQADKFSNQRAEMWWNMRTLVQTDKENPDPQVKLDLDQKVLAQLSAPIYKSDSAGRILIESKKDMKRRGLGSPDRAEAVLLALYEPKARIIPNVSPISIEGVNDWGNL
jgi:hypothetical protein